MEPTTGAWRSLVSGTGSLARRYAAQRLSAVLSGLSWFHTGEMVLYYIRRYGFYQGHTS